MLFAWQGWKLEIPHRWSPVRLEGDYIQGYALIADLQHPRLGIRWTTAGKRKFDAGQWSKLSIAKEAGVLAGDESRPLPARASDFASAWEGGRLYAEPKPPGRDVWAAYSPCSRRMVQVIYHAQRRDSTLERRLLPTLVDQDPAAEMQWAAFDLLCVSPSGWRLKSHRLNVGDLSLTFSGNQRAQATVRQVALASLALKRLPLEKWLREQLRTRRTYYRAIGEPVAFAAGELRGLQLLTKRRIQFSLHRSLPKEVFTIAVVDETRDRLVIVEAADAQQATKLLSRVSSPLTPAMAAGGAS